MAEKNCTDPCAALRLCALDLECDVGTMKSLDYVIGTLLEDVAAMPGEDELIGALISMSGMLHVQLKETDQHVRALQGAIRATRQGVAQ